MIVEIGKPVPGLVNFRVLRTGDVTELEDATAVSLIQDGYATEVRRETPAETAEKAVEPRSARRGTRH